MRNKRLLLSLVLAGVMSAGTSYAADTNFMLQDHVSVPGGKTKMTFRLRGTTLREALQLISETSGLNLVLDDSVQGAVSLDFFQTPLDQILETMLYSNGYSLQPYGKSYVVYRTGQYGQPVMRFVPLRFVSADTILPELYDLLDLKPTDSGTTSGAASASSDVVGTSGSSSAEVPGVSSINSAPQAVQDLFKLTIKTEPRANRIVLTGPQDKVNRAEELVHRLDVLTPSRVFPLNFISPKDAVDFLHATFFETNGSAKPVGTIVSNVRDFASSAAGSIPQLRKDNVDVSEQTPRFVPMPTQNALLVIGTANELQLVDQVLRTIDKRRPQVLIKAEIVEMSVDDARNLGMSYQAGSRQLGASFQQNNGSFTFDTLGNQGLNLQVQLNALVTSKRAKMLASPQLLAMDNRTSVIKITDDIVAQMTSTITQNANQTIVTKTVTPGQAGVTLELTPRIDSTGGVTMAIHPTISSVGDQIKDPQTGDLIATLKHNREYQTQEIYVRDGQTIVIGGLIQNLKTESVSKLPILGDIPFLGGLFQLHNNDDRQSEVQIFLTPEVIKDANAST